jgi:mono/diheme cytochrome c family protein
MTHSSMKRHRPVGFPRIFSMPRPLGILRRPAAIGLGLLLTAFVAWAAADWYRTVPDDALQHARYVGREACIACHQTEYDLWKGSDHDRAM